MSDQVQEILDIPKDFVKEGTQFLSRCQKPDQKEFIKISSAVGIGFLIMGTIGYIIKLSMLPALLLRHGLGISHGPRITCPVLEVFHERKLTMFSP
ncbi:hypothetical protein BX600DRAFT_465167 [Xylariales sp. PMI_506]|nr:hypothetical protein BX600DRAFT_465167 [Xylariales sp. PMI_506]